MMSIDQGKPVILVLLELTAAFDTVDHNVLFSELTYMFCLSDKVLESFQSYMEQRSQRVSVQGINKELKISSSLKNLEYYIAATGLWMTSKTK